MKQLLLIAHIDDAKLKSILIKIEGKELIKLSEACYAPKHKAYYAELMEACELKEQNIEDFAERTWNGRREVNWKNASDEISLFSVWLMWYFLNRKDLATFRAALIYHMIRQYANLFKKYFRYPCNPDVFNDTLDSLTKTHLFSREGTIFNAISYLSDRLKDKFIEGIGTWDLDAISAFIRESRQRLNQSLKSFARSYYKNKTKPRVYVTPNEEGEGAFYLDKADRLISDITDFICARGYIDQEALSDAKTITEIRMATATLLVNELSNTTTSVQYFDKVKYILELFLKELPSVKRINEKKAEHLEYLKRLMSVKRTTKPVYFKMEVWELLLAILKNVGYEKEFSSLTRQTQFLISKFLAYYVTMVLIKEM